MIESIKIQPLNQNNIKTNRPTFNNQINNKIQKIESTNSDILNFDKKIEPDDISNTLSNNESEIINTYEESDNQLADLIIKSTSTDIVTKIKVAAGVYDIVEHISDGLLWTGGKIIEGSSYAVAQVTGCFDNDTKSSILNWREDAKDWTKDTIKINVVDNIEDAIFNTKLGKRINDESLIKYDSKTANTIENITKIGTEIAGATAATIATGGAASPTLIAVVGGLGFTESAGSQAQKTYQNNINTTAAKEAGIFFSGLEGATRWYAYGRLGTGAISISNQISEIATHGQWSSQFGGSTTIKEALKTMFTTRRYRNAKQYLLKSAKTAATSFTDIVDMSGGIFGTIADSLSDDNISPTETGARICSGLAQNFIINTGVNRVDYLGKSLRTPFTDSLDNRVISLIKTLIETADAAEDSGVLPLDIYDIGENIASSIKERSK